MAANPQMQSLQVMQEVGRSWQSLTETNRKYFDNKANRDKIRYLKEMRQFYDEIERIGEKVGTVRQKDGLYNVATAVSKTKKGEV